MNELTTFNFNENQIRTETIDGNPWFCLLDCCKALGIKNAATTVKLSEAGVGKTYCRYESGKKEITIINEPNLYRLIFRSNKPQAQAFADWVYSEVLPAIRKTGSYTYPAQDELGLVPVPYDITADKKAMRAIGGMIKRCCATAIREELTNGTDAAQGMVSTLIDYIVAERTKNALNNKLAEMRKLLA